MYFPHSSILLLDVVPDASNRRRPPCRRVRPRRAARKVSREASSDIVTRWRAHGFTERWRRKDRLSKVAGAILERNLTSACRRRFFFGHVGCLSQSLDSPSGRAGKCHSAANFAQEPSLALGCPWSWRRKPAAQGTSRSMPPSTPSSKVDAHWHLQAANVDAALVGTQHSFSISFWDCNLGFANPEGVCTIGFASRSGHAKPKFRQPRMRVHHRVRLSL